jgi:hypothetical protein
MTKPTPGLIFEHVSGDLYIVATVGGGLVTYRPVYSDTPVCNCHVESFGDFCKRVVESSPLQFLFDPPLTKGDWLMVRYGLEALGREHNASKLGRTGRHPMEPDQLLKLAKLYQRVAEALA